MPQDRSQRLGWRENGLAESSDFVQIDRLAQILNQPAIRGLLNDELHASIGHRRAEDG